MLPPLEIICGTDESPSLLLRFFVLPNVAPSLPLALKNMSESPSVSSCHTIRAASETEDICALASVLVSALAGLGSFLSPCILPILPGFISYLSGTAANEAKKSETTTTEIGTTTTSNSGRQSLTVKRITRLNIFLNTVYFVLGFSLVFAILGVILNSVLATTVGNGFQHSLTLVGGIVIIGFGVYLILSTKLRTLNFEMKMTRLPRFKTSYITSFVFGAAFAAGWTPCVGPILGSTFTLAASGSSCRALELILYITVDYRVLPLRVLYALLYGRHGQRLPLVGQLASNTFYNI